MTPSEIVAPLRGRRLLVGLSGGVDSVVLTHLLATAGCDVRAAHVDHKLRADSYLDAELAANLASSLGIPFGLATLDIARGNSTQGRARTQRYAALVRLAAQLGADALCVAHHADDAWESSELQRARGAGAAGLAGPAPQSSWWEFPVLRPLLGVRRSWVLRYAREHDLRWRDDPSNADPHYARTRIRAADNFDLDELTRRQLDANHVTARSATLGDGAQRSPLKFAWRRDALLSAHRVERAHVIIAAARQLHGELPGPLVDAILDALRGSDAPQRFCGRRVVVHLDADTVTVEASRGHGTRLLDARRVARVALAPDVEIPWFDHRITTSKNHLPDAMLLPENAAIGVPAPGTRLAGTPVRQLLADHHVPHAMRDFWPCAYIEDRCVAVLGVSSSKDFPAGMFVQIQQF